MKWLVGLACLFWSVQAGAEALPAEPPPSLALVTDTTCADLDTESAFAKELRIRLPDMALTVGAVAASNTWYLHWIPRGEACWLEIRGPEETELEIPNPAKKGDLELAASQVAWIVTMSVRESPPVVEPPPAVEPPIDQGLSDAQDAVPTDPPPPPPLPTQDPPLVQDEAAPDQVQPDDDIVEGGVVFALGPGLLIPANAPRKHVPSMAIEIISPGHFGIRGMELAWVFASAGFVDGIQMALAAAHTGSLSGFQLSLGYNHADKVDGFQLSVGGNHAHDVEGFQLALGANIADRVDGFQIAVGVNIADVPDVQIAAVNVADRASLQMGLVNISETSDVPIGLINVMTDEPVFGTAWLGSSGLVAAGILHGGKHFRYAYMLVGMPSTRTNRQVAGFGLGASLHFDFDGFFFDTELYGFQLSDDPVKQNFMLNLRGIFGWQIFDRFAVFAGPALVSYWSGALDGLGVQPGYSIESLGAPGTANRWDWAEFQAGVRF